MHRPQYPTLSAYGQEDPETRADHGQPRCHSLIPPVVLSYHDVASLVTQDEATELALAEAAQSAFVPKSS